LRFLSMRSHFVSNVQPPLDDFGPTVINSRTGHFKI
jgi:hypothetical protein